MDSLDRDPTGTPASGRGFPSLLARGLFLTGPTAAGKSEVAVELAQRLGCEIFSVDSMAVYRGMDIGTAKPRPDQQQRVRHHLIDLVDPSEEFSVGQYLDAAHRTLADHGRSGLCNLFVGGTPLYLNGLIRGMYVGPPADPDFRRAVEADIDRYGLEALRQRLWQVDPLTAHRLHPNDRRRIVRALEVAHHTGRPLSHHQLQFDTHTAAERCFVFALAVQRSELHRRVDARVEQMFASGLVDEVAGLASRPGGMGRTARQAVGYREVLQLLDGELTCDEAIEAVKVSTHRLVRKQETWFRSMTEVTAVPVQPEQPASETVRQILDVCQNRGFQFAPPGVDS